MLSLGVNFEIPKTWNNSIL